VRRFLTFPALALAVAAIGSPAGAADALTVSPVTLFPATSGIFYSAVFRASGGTGPYSYSIVSGHLPVGMALSSDGTIRGVPDDAPGRFTFTVQALDQTDATATCTVTLALATPRVVLTSVAAPAARVGERYRFELSATGGSPRCAYSVARGSLPKGLDLARNGVLSGTPKAAGVSLFTLQVVDSHGIPGVQTFRFVVAKARVKPHAPE